MARLTGLPLTASIARMAVPTAALGYVVAVIVALARSDSPPTSYAQAGQLLGALDRAAGLGLIAAGVYAWVVRPGTRVGLLAMLTGVVWFGPDWLGAIGASDLVRSLGLVMTPFVLPLVAHLVLAATGGFGQSPPARRVVPLLYWATAVLIAVRVVTYLPFDERYCWAICTETGNVFLYGGGNAAATRLLNSVWLTLASAAWLGLAVWCAGRVRISTRVAQPGRRAVLLATVALGAAWAAYGITLLLLRDERPVGPHSSLFESLFLARALATSALAAGLALMVTGERRRSAAVRDVAVAIAAAPAPGSLEATLARALADDSLEVIFPLDEGQRYVDGSGGSVARPAASPDRALTPIERGGKPIAIVIHDAGIDSRLLEHEIGSAARLAVDNERLRAVVLAQLRELRASRARIVEVGDAERRRLERDLHDGAQQRLLALSYEIRIARTAAERAGDSDLAERLSRADSLSQRAIEELRQLAHGIYPAVLAEAGLGPALATLSDEATLPVELDTSVGGRLPAAVEIAAYQVVADALAGAVRRSASYLGVRIARDDDLLRLEITDDGMSPIGALVRAADRVGAAGGSMSFGAPRSGGGAFIRVELPCA